MNASYLLLKRHAGSTGPYPFPPESGPLHRDGAYLKDAQGRVWGGRGLTMFLLYARFLRGEDITPQLTWARAVGANYLRIFGQVPVPPWAPQWSFYSLPDPDDYRELRRFVDLAGQHGLRIEWCPICGPWMPHEGREMLEASYAALSGAWNIFVEWCNEPGQSGTFHHNLHTSFDAIDRRGILSATGVSAIPPDWMAQQILGLDKVTSFAQMHWLDFGTAHINGTEYGGSVNARYPRNSKYARDWRDGDAEVGMPGSGCATWLDEDARVDDSDTYPGLEDHVSHNAIGLLLSGSQLVHYGIGREGLMPTPGGFEDQVVAATTALWKFIPAESQTGAYSRPPWASFPLEWHDTQSSTVNHAYASILGDTAYVVNCLPPAGWVARPKPGWRILEVGPRPWILKMGR